MSEIDTAMVLAAGFGKRLRPITETTPKPLVEVAGVSLLERTLSKVREAKIPRAVVNVHYLGEQIIDHCATRTERPACDISDESGEILETGGGVVKALPKLEPRPFVLLNADTFWIDGPEPCLPKMMEIFDAATMDILLLVCRPEDTTGHGNTVDFLIDDHGRLSRADDKRDPMGVIYAGCAILNPAIFDHAKVEPHSLNVYFDKAIEEKRLFGHVLKGGHWITVGTPQGLADAEAKLASLLPNDTAGVRE
ncbi:MAG: nucleotidyltransferase family protein [Pseudomonadota bacterium]